VIGDNSIAGGHQGLAAGSGWNLGGQGQPPPNIGHVPSHISVATHKTAATSVVATSASEEQTCDLAKQIVLSNRYHYSQTIYCIVRYN
jgi:hypothetical protein